MQGIDSDGDASSGLESERNFSRELSPVRESSSIRESNSMREASPERAEFSNKDAHVRTQSHGLFSFLSRLDVQLVGALTFVAVLVRLAFLSNPPVVIFDEVHFGGFASKYLRGEFFLDVHPPLARLLVTLAGWLSGFRGDFSFHDIGVDYRRHAVPYVGMRAGSALFGVATVPLAFLTLTALGTSRMAAVAGALLVLFENALATQSRLILLDAYLIFFTAAALLAWTLFRREERDATRHFGTQWWMTLATTGAALGCATSCKWVGLFTVATVGVQVVGGLWALWCNTLVPLRRIGQHVAAKAACLLALPAAIYVAAFWIHFALLHQHTSAAASMTLQFQQSFAGGAIPPTNGPVYYGSTITLRQARRDSPGFLHSHEALYPAGTKQQQVTIYHHQDSNNEFVIRRPFVVGMTYTEADLEAPFEEEGLFRLRHGDQVRLLHVNTGRFLHSHNEPAPVSTKKEHHCEVSGYGHHATHFSDLNDNWTVHIVGANGEPLPHPPRREDSPPISALQHRLIFLHPLAGCVLHSNNKPLPEWGFRQGEVTCSREVRKGHTHWIIESNEHPLHGEDKDNFVARQRRASFWEKFAELNGRMWVTNQGLTASHYFQSSPATWPFLRRGLGFWNALQVPRSEAEIAAERAARNPRLAAEQPEVDAAARETEKENYRVLGQQLKGRQVYLLGNVVTWLAVTAGVFTLALLAVGAVVVRQRIRFAPGLGPLRQAIGLVLDLAGLQSATGLLLSAWMLHYFPFFLMDRQLFLHHYLPALYCGILFLVALVDGLAVAGGRGRVICFAALVGVAGLVFVAYAPLGYGLPLSTRVCRALKLRSGWDWDCQDALVA